MQTLAAKRRSGREAQARYAARLKEAGVPSRNQLLAAIEVGTRAAVRRVGVMPPGPERDAAARVVGIVTLEAVEHLEGQPGLDPKAVRMAFARLMTGLSDAQIAQAHR